MKIKNKNLIVLSLAGSVALSACGGGGGGSNVNSGPNSDLLYIADASVNGTYELFSNTREGDEDATLTQGSFGSGVNWKFQVSPNGRYVAFRNEGNMPDVSELYVDDLDDDLPPIKVNDDFVSLVSQATSQVFSFKWSPNSDKLAFTVEHENSDRHELYIVGVDGTQPAVMITDEMIPRDNDSFTLDREAYDWSPDGQRLAYIADQNSADDAELFTAFANGFGKFTLMNPDLVTGGDVVGFKWSPDSQRILYRADQDENGVYEMYSSESLSNNLINAKMNPVPDDGENVSSKYGWSQDGTHIAFIGDLDTVDKDELYTSNFTGAIGVKVSLDAIDSVSSFRWSPVENRLAYFGGDQDRSDLYTVLPTSDEHAQLSNPLSLADSIIHGYDWAPDGSRIAFEIYIDSTDQIDLFTASVDGSTRDQINTQGNVGSFAWSPDSQSIAYRADEDMAGVNELYTANVDGQNTIKVNGVLTDEGDVRRFQWSPDGLSLAYRADQEVDGTFELYTVDHDGLNREKVSASPQPNGGIDTFLWRP